jgi:FixJ family two-component response regulator
MPTVPKIFIVDDDAEVREATASLIQSLGYEVDTFASAQEFLDSGRVSQASCLITDVQMPGISGYDLRQQLLAEGHRIPIVFMSGLFGEDIPEKSPMADVIGFLDKPVDISLLIECINRALKG